MRFAFLKPNKTESTTKIIERVGVLFFLIQCCMAFFVSFSGVKNIASAEVPAVGLIANFSTYYGESAENRKHNIALAASKINDTVLYPEDEFSFNDVVGPRREERGFKKANIIRDGEFVEGTGGGVCQVSTTIYNCALLADLAITRVQPHSLPVSYVSPSFDAMVSSASDLRFANTLSAPVTIKMYADGRFLKCEIYGVAGRSVRRRYAITGTVPMETVYVDDDTLNIGEEKIDSFGQNGIKSVGYLEYFADGKMIDSIKIRTDSYAPQKRVILRGTKSQTISDIDTAPRGEL